MKNNEFDLALSMAHILDPQSLQKKSFAYNINETLSNLSKAAEILDNMGLVVYAEAVTQLIEKLPSSLNKKAQRYGFGGLKYLIELFADSIMAVRPKAEVPELSESKELQRLDDFIGSIQTEIESKDFSDLDTKSMIKELMNEVKYFIPLAKSLSPNGLPPVLIKLTELSNIWSDISYKDPTPEPEFSEYLEDFMRQEEEESGRDFNEPTVKFVNEEASDEIYTDLYEEDENYWPGR